MRSPAGDVKLSLSNQTSVTELKEAYKAALEKSKAGNGASIDSMRLFYMGREMQADLWLYSYDMKDEMTIQALIKK